MSIQTFDCEQGSAEWFACRKGIPTASEFSTVLAKGKDGGDSKTRRKYMLRLAGEILSGDPQETFTSLAMERGKIMEAEAREFYAFLTDAALQRVGFVRNGDKGCSPDCLVGDDGMLEIKTAQPDILLDIIDRDRVPPEHAAQLQGNLWVAERQWIDLIVYWPKLPPFVRRVHRDEKYITDLALAVDRFNFELGEIVAKFRSYKPAKEAA